MNQGYSTITFNLNRLIATNLNHKNRYFLSIIIGDIEKNTGYIKRQMSSKQKLKIEEIVAITLLNSKIKRKASCEISVYEQFHNHNAPNQKICVGKVIFSLMDYKTYSKKKYQLVDCKEGTKGYLQMSIQIKIQSKDSSSNLNVPCEQNQLQRTSQKFNNNQNQKKSVQDTTSNRQIICNNIENHGLFGQILESEETIENKNQKNINLKRKKSAMSSLQNFIEKDCQIFDTSMREKEGQRKKLFETAFVNKSFKNKYKLSPPGTPDSQALKYLYPAGFTSFQVQKNLRHLEELETQSNAYNKKYSSVFKISNQQNPSIFETLNMMNKKMEKIYEKQAILNSEDEQQQDSNLIKPSYYEDIDGKSSENNSNLANIKWDKLKSDRQQDINHQNSQLSHIKSNARIQISQAKNIFSSFNGSYDEESIARNKNKRYKIQRTVDLRLYYDQNPQKKFMKFQKTLEIKILGSARYYDKSIENNFYRLNIPSEARQKSQQTRNQFQKLRSSRISEHLSQYQIENGNIQNEMYKKYEFFKLNKLHLLSKAADSTKKRNIFLIKANNELLVEQQRLEQKLLISKSIISEKQDMLKIQFEELKNQIKIISDKLILKNDESNKRQSFLKALQDQVEGYVRENNKLKQEIKEKVKEVHELRYFLYQNFSQKQQFQQQNQFCQKQFYQKKDIQCRSTRLQPNSKTQSQIRDNSLIAYQSEIKSKRNMSQALQKEINLNGKKLNLNSQIKEYPLNVLKIGCFGMQEEVNYKINRLNTERNLKRNISFIDYLLDKKSSKK